MRLQVITNSELETWRTCGQRHGFAYVELLRPAMSAAPLTEGHILHHGIEAGWMAAWAEPDISYQERLVIAREASCVAIESQIGEQQELLGSRLPEAQDPDRIEEAIEGLEAQRSALIWAVGHYFEEAAPDLDYVPILVEAEYAIRIPYRNGRASNVEQRGKRDLVLWDREANRLIVQDHKGTSGNVRQMEAKMALNTQLSGYVYELKLRQQLGPDGFLEAILGAKSTPQGALECLSRPQAKEALGRARVGHVTLNVIRRAKPEQPKVNLLTKKQATTEKLLAALEIQTEMGIHAGEVSVAACDTTAAVYQDALEAQERRGLPRTEKQREYLEKLERKADTFFAQLAYFRDSDELERWRNEVIVDAAAIRDAARRGRTRNPGACSAPWSPRCPYAELCMHPDDPVIRSQYVVADRPHQELQAFSPGEQQGE